MALDDCIDKIVAGLAKNCLASQFEGGIKKRVWIGNLDDIIHTKDDDGYIDSISLTASPAATLFKFVGREFKHNQTYTGVIGENTNLINPALNLVLYYFTPAERAAIEGLYNAEDLVAFIQRTGADGKTCIEVVGIQNGLTAPALTGGTGALINDPTGITITLSGEERSLNKVLEAGTFLPSEEGYLDENITYLDNLSAE